MHGRHQGASVVPKKTWTMRHAAISVPLQFRRRGGEERWARRHAVVEQREGKPLGCRELGDALMYFAGSTWRRRNIHSVSLGSCVCGYGRIAQVQAIGNSTVTRGAISQRL